MTMTYNGTEPTTITYNGNDVSSVIYNGVEVWSAVDPVFANNSWADIKKIAQSGRAANYFSVGDRKSITISNEYIDDGTYDCIIIGINHNASREGANKIHFMITKKDTSTTLGSVGSHCMNKTNTNTGGWASSFMRNTVLTSLKESLPADLKNVIGTVKKWTDNLGGAPYSAAGVTETTEYLFLLSVYELYGRINGEQQFAGWTANPTEANYQIQYDYWKNGGSKATDNYCWLRSVLWENSNDTQHFFTTQNNETPFGGIASAYNSFFPCFVI